MKRKFVTEFPGIIPTELPSDAEVDSPAGQSGTPILTGVPFVDRSLHDGVCPGDVVGILGPDNGMHHVTMAQLAASLALRFAGTDPHKAVFYLTVLEPWYAQERLRQTSDTVWRSHIAQGTSFQDAAVFPDVPPFAVNNLFLIDLSGPWDTEVSSQMRPIACRVVKSLENAARETGREIGAVFLEQAMFACENCLGALGRRERWRVSRLLNGVVGNCREFVAKQFECPIFMSHLLKPKNGSDPPTMQQDHFGATDSRDFGPALDFAFVLGNRDLWSHCCLLACTKAIRPPRDPRPAIVQVAGSSGVLREVGDRYRVDHVRRRIVAVDEQIALDIDNLTAAKLKASK